MDDLIYDRHKVVPTLEWEELTDEERKEYPWDTYGTAIYFRYLGRIYSDQDFMDSSEDGWDGIQSDTYFSGTLIKFSEDFEKVDCCRVYA